jgi:hypothetical protein
LQAQVYAPLFVFVILTEHCLLPLADSDHFAGHRTEAKHPFKLTDHTHQRQGLEAVFDYPCNRLVVTQQLEEPQPVQSAIFCQVRIKDGNFVAVSIYKSNRSR